MKILKYLLLTFGALGIIASIYNTIHDGTMSGQKIGLLSSIFLIYASFNVERYVTVIREKINSLQKK